MNLKLACATPQDKSDANRCRPGSFGKKKNIISLQYDSLYFGLTLSGPSNIDVALIAPNATNARYKFVGVTTNIPPIHSFIVPMSMAHHSMILEADNLDGAYISFTKNAGKLIQPYTETYSLQSGRVLAEVLINSNSNGILDHTVMYAVEMQALNLNNLELLIPGVSKIFNTGAARFTRYYNHVAILLNDTNSYDDLILSLNDLLNNIILYPRTGEVILTKVTPTPPTINMLALKNAFISNSWTFTIDGV